MRPFSTKPMRAKLDRTYTVPSSLPVYDSSLASRIAGVKVILAALNLLVILLDHTVPVVGTPFALAQSLVIGGIFFSYMLLSYVALKKNWVTIQSYRVTGPFLDIIFCSLLILGTDGYLSPFNLWLVMSIVSASFSSDQRIVLSATALAVVLGSLIAFVPQETPLDIPVFVVRTGFLLAFGLVIAYLGNHIARKSALLAAIDSYASSATLSESAPEAAEVLLNAIDASLQPKAMMLELEDGLRLLRGEPSSPESLSEFAVTSGTARFGLLSLEPSNGLTSDDTRLVRTLLDRFCLTLRRIVAAEELRKSAQQEARLRLADELHDTHIQTLTAIDLQIEAVLSRVGKANGPEPKGARTSDQAGPSSLSNDLMKMRSLARESIVGLRDFIANGPIQSTDDVDEIVARAAKNWSGGFERRAQSDLLLSRAAWGAIEILLREGLSNARRHGRSDSALFTLERKNHMIEAKLLTNGDSPELPLTRRGYGLTRVAAAVRDAGGQMMLAPGPEGGASLSATFEEMVP